MSRAGYLNDTDHSSVRSSGISPLGGLSRRSSTGSAARSVSCLRVGVSDDSGDSGDSDDLDDAGDSLDLGGSGGSNAAIMNATGRVARSVAQSRSSRIATNPASTTPIPIPTRLDDVSPMTPVAARRSPTATIAIPLTRTGAADTAAMPRWATAAARDSSTAAAIRLIPESSMRRTGPTVRVSRRSITITAGSGSAVSHW